MNSGPLLPAPPPVVKRPAAGQAALVARLVRLLTPAKAVLRTLRSQLTSWAGPRQAPEAGDGPHSLFRMQWVRPKSLTGLMLLGLAFIAVPLLWAIITAAFQMETLTTTGQQLVNDGATASAASHDVTDELAAVERDIRLYDTMHDARYSGNYRRDSASLAKNRLQLSKRATGPVQRTLAEIGNLQTDLDKVMAELYADPHTPRGSEIPEHSRFDTLGESLDVQTRQQIKGQLRVLQAQAERARSRVFLESAGLVPLTALAIFGLTIVIGRPLRRLDRAISDLGEKKNLSKPIEVPGPHDLERLGTRLEWLRRRMLELDNERSRFMREMSHELKTPLAAIADGTELLMDGTVGTLDPAQQEVMEILREKSKLLQEMIENVLSFAAWENARVGLLPREFGLRSIVKQVIENHRIMILRQRIRLDLRIDDITLVADRSKFRLIVENLVSNALKYSPKAGIIHLKAHQEGSQLVLEVADHGPGIAVDERDHIFNAFYTGRAAKARKSSQKGTGIGLSVVLEFVSAHQGRIEIIDGEYPGAHFRVTMPLRLGGNDVPGNENPRANAA
jgi:two-component system, NtrC family, sensor histidine kinase GlrK